MQWWRAIKIHEGDLGFTQSGITHSVLFAYFSTTVDFFAQVAAPLAAAQISLFHMSTYTTDWALVHEHSLPEAMECLEENGFTFVPFSEAPSTTELTENSKAGGAQRLELSPTPERLSPG